VEPHTYVHVTGHLKNMVQAHAPHKRGCKCLYCERRQDNLGKVSRESSEQLTDYIESQMTHHHEKVATGGKSRSLWKLVRNVRRASLPGQFGASDNSLSALLPSLRPRFALGPTTA
jgi:hypothetical protein